MKLHLDVETCVGHGRCYALAPDVYDADEHGHCVLRFGEGGDVPAELHDAARLGVTNCPEEALSLTE